MTQTSIPAAELHLAWAAKQVKTVESFIKRVETWGRAVDAHINTGAPLTGRPVSKAAKGNAYSAAGWVRRDLRLNVPQERTVDDLKVTVAAAKVEIDRLRRHL